MTTIQPALRLPQRRLASANELAGYVVMCVIIGVFIFLAVTTRGYLTTANLRSVLDQSAFIGLFSLATALMMISGNLFSLSISATGAVTASLALYLLSNGGAFAIVITLVVATVIFAIQGLLVGALGANPIIVSIAAGGLQEGVFLWLSRGATINPPMGNTSLSFTESLVKIPGLGALPVACFILVGLVIAVEIVLRRTTFGRSIFLVGENRRAAHAAGIPTGWIIVGVFALAGLLIGVVGVEIGAFNGSGSLLDESTFTYDGIAAAVVGGIAVTGGRGSAWQALFGAIFIQAVADLMLLRGYTEGWQLLAKGIVVFAVVILVRLLRGRAASS